MRDFLEGLYLFLYIVLIIGYLLYGVCLIVYFVFYITKEKLAPFYKKKIKQNNKRAKAKKHLKNNEEYIEENNAFEV